MTQAPDEPAVVQKYTNTTIMDLESTIDSLQAKQTANPASNFSKELAIARRALQQRQREIKGRAALFERTNYQFLLFFHSTNGYVKLIGHSALFFAATIAERIHWRCSIKADTDRYFPSEDGVISFRSFDKISTRLAKIELCPNQDLDSEELHYFQLDRTYSEDQISRLRDRAKHDMDQVMTMVLPISPIPSLYGAIIQASQAVYGLFRYSTDSFARDTIGKSLIRLNHQMSNEYLKFAHAKPPKDIEHLVRIIELSRELRYGMVYAGKIQILHHQDVKRIIEQLIAIERIATKAYLRNRQTHIV